MPFVLYRSNRVEQLAQALAQVVREPLPSALARELIVVQGPGMERWLSMQLSQRLGVWANPWFPFPRTLIELSLEATLGPAPQSAELYRPGALAFLIARLLPSLLAEGELHDVSSYLAGDMQGDRLLALSESLARTYDQYLIYRPELLLGWESSSERQFQALLWRAVCTEAGPVHIAHRRAAFERSLSRPDFASKLRDKLPPRIHVFGVSTLPPAFLSILTQLSRVLDVHFFMLSPTPEYYGDLDRKLGTGHDMTSLLASLGKVGRELMEQLTDVDMIERDLFLPPAPDSLLHVLQSDLLTLTVRGPSAEPPLSVSEHDTSLRIHACHSPEREIEVLHDQLRARFEADRSLSPHDVIVFAPDIERYVPAIESVFGAVSHSDHTAIPYRIADRRASRVSDVTDTFLTLLDLSSSRFYLSDALDLLHRSPVRLRFGLGDADLDLAQRWLVKAGARWAIDAEHRERSGQPKLAQNSLRFGLDRLLLGLVTRGGQAEPFGEVLPTADIEGQEALTLAKVSRYFEELFQTARELNVPRKAADWALRMSTALSRLLSDAGELALGHYALRVALADLLNDAAAADLQAPISLASMRRALAERVDQTRANAGFLSGGITFCEHVPMRAIPFRIVCMVGLDDESFPRRSTRPSFDLMAKQPRLGDRALRDDDRQLFLEALLSARDAILITYCGRSPKDDTVRPPSVLLDQLLRVVDSHAILRGADASLSLGLEGSTAQQISHVHALSRFDRRYFKNVRDLVYFSYDPSGCEVARAWLDDKPRTLTPFVSAPIKLDAPADASLEIEELIRFLRLPAKHFLQTRLGVYLPRELDPIEDREPLAPDPLERWEVGNDILDELSDLSPEERHTRLAREGRIPPGTLGQLWMRDVELTALAIDSACPQAERSPDLALEIELGARKLVGTVRDLCGTTRSERTFSIPRTKHLLACWVRHLALCAAHPQTPWQSVLVGRAKDGAKTYRFEPEPDARALLSELVTLYELGRTCPLPFFIDAADSYVKAINKGDAHQAALTSIAGSAGKVEVRRDVDDPYVRQVFGPLSAEDLGTLRAPGNSEGTDFPTLALRIVRPMLANAERAGRS